MEELKIADPMVAALVQQGLEKIRAEEERFQQAEEMRKAAILGAWDKVEEEIRSVFPDEIRQYVSIDKDPTRAPKNLSGMRNVSLTITGLAPIQVWMVCENGQWTFGENDDRKQFRPFRIPGISAWDEVRWDFEYQYEGTNSLDLALALAYRAQQQFDATCTERAATKAVPTIEATYVPVDEPVEPKNDLVAGLIELIRDVVREEMNN